MLPRSLPPRAPRPGRRSKRGIHRPDDPWTGQVGAARPRTGGGAAWDRGRGDHRLRSRSWSTPASRPPASVAVHDVVAEVLPRGDIVVTTTIELDAVDGRLATLRARDHVMELAAVRRAAALAARSSGRSVPKACARSVTHVSGLTVTDVSGSGPAELTFREVGFAPGVLPGPAAVAAADSGSRRGGDDGPERRRGMRL